MHVDRVSVQPRSQTSQYQRYGFAVRTSPEAIACASKRACPTGSLAALPAAPPTFRGPANWMPSTMGT